MHKFKIRALGEIAIRCKDYDAMRTFYGEVLKLTPLNESIGGKMPAANIQFYQLGESYGGHTSILALFTDEHKHQTNSGTSSSLHHIALTVAYKAQDAAK